MIKLTLELTDQEVSHLQEILANAVFSVASDEVISFASELYYVITEQVKSI